MKELQYFIQKCEDTYNDTLGVLRFSTRTPTVSRAYFGQNKPNLHIHILKKQTLILKRSFQAKKQTRNRPSRDGTVMKNTVHP